MRWLGFAQGYRSYSLVGEIYKSPESLPCVKEGGTIKYRDGRIVNTKQRNFEDGLKLDRVMTYKHP